MAVSQAFIFHFKWYSLLHFAYASFYAGLSCYSKYLGSGDRQGKHYYWYQIASPLIVIVMMSFHPGMGLHTFILTHSQGQIQSCVYVNCEYLVKEEMKINFSISKQMAQLNCMFRLLVSTCMALAVMVFLHMPFHIVRCIILIIISIIIFILII